MNRSGAIVIALLAAAMPLAAQTRTYVAHSAANVVTVIDSATRTVAGTIPVGGATRVVTSRDGTRVYVSSGATDAVSIIDTTSGSVTTIPVGDNPSYLALSPDGQWLYVMTGSGVVEVVDAAQRTIVSTIAIGAVGDIAFAPDGSRAYVAAGHVHVIDTATTTVAASFAPETVASPTVSNSAVSVAIAPDGARAYIGRTTFDVTGGGFGAGGDVVVVDTSTNTVIGAIWLGSLPGSIALTPDGSRAYVGIQSTFVNTGYGAGFFPGRTVAVLDLATGSVVGQIDLGADGPNWTQQNTAAGIGVTPDRSDVHIVVPRVGVVAVAEVNSNVVAQRIPVGPTPGALAIEPDASVALLPYVVNAVDDSVTVTTAGGTALASVLANDTFGGIPARLAHVTLSQVSSTATGVALDTVSGAVVVEPGTEIAIHTLVYRLCEIASPANCDDATVAIAVREIYPIVATDDAATSLPARTALASVLANDTLKGAIATTATVTLSVVSSTSTGLTLNVSTGSLFVSAGTAGPQTLVYRICEKASPINCDDAAVTITVLAFAIDAVDDSGAARRTGGTAVANVLANDRFNGAVATPAKVRLSQLATTHAGVSLNTATGAVAVAAGTPVGGYTLRYRICEAASPSNCDDADVAVTVQPALIVAANDTARGSSKTASTILASVLTNDRLAGMPVTTATVRLSLVSLTPANSKIRLDIADGSVDVLGKTSSGVYSMVYEICEIASPGNCARATVRIDLSGGA